MFRIPSGGAKTKGKGWIVSEQLDAKWDAPRSLEDVDLFGPGAQEHWYAAYDILLREAPVCRLPGQGTTAETDGFILSKYEDIVAVVKDWKRFPPVQYMVPPVAPSCQRPVLPEEVPLPQTDDGAFVFSIGTTSLGQSMASLRPTPDLWRQHRQQLTDPWVGPGAGRHKEMIRETVDGLIDDWIDKGAVEFVSEFSAPLPQIVMTRVLGFPMEDLPKLREWGTQQVFRFVHSKDHRSFITLDEEAAQETVLREFDAYLLEQVANKRNSPGDDMISWLTEVVYQPLERKLTDIEVAGIIYGMHLGGLETTQYAIAEQAQLVCETPGLFERLKKDRSRLKYFIEEGLRLRAPTQGLSTRMTTRDEVIRGVRVPKGSVLHLRFAAGNLDPEEFQCPKELQLDRKAPTRQLAFSQGPRSCPGQSISRIEQTIAWERLLDRLDTLTYAPDVSIEHQPGFMLGTLELKLAFKKSKSGATTSA